MLAEGESNAVQSSESSTPVKLLTSIFENMSDGVSVFDETGRIVFCNPAMGILTGRPLPELEGKTPAEAWGAAEIVPLDSSSYTTFEEAISRADGQTRYVSVKAFGISAEPHFRAAIYRDVTRLKQAQRGHHEAEQAYRLLVDSLSDGVAIIQEGRFKFVSKRFAELLRCEVADLLEKQEETVFSPMTDEPGGTGSHAEGPFETTYRGIDGSLLPFEVTHSNIIYRGQHAVLKSIRDITSARRTEKMNAALGLMAKRLGSAKTPAEVGQVVLDIALRLFGWDAAYFAIIASDLEQKLLPGHVVIPLVIYDTFDGERKMVPLPAEYKMAPTSPTVRVIEEGALLFNGAEADLLRTQQRFGNTSQSSASLMFVPIVGTSGPTGVISLQSYTSNAYQEWQLNALQLVAENCAGALERTRAEQNLRLLEMAVSHANDMVLITAATPGSESPSVIVYVNEAFERITGYTRDDVLGKSVQVLQGGETDSQVLERLREALLNDRPVTVELVNYKKDKTPYEVEFTAFPISDGIFRYFVSVQRDITERKREHRQLTHKAFHDPLTNLPNRLLLMERLNRAMSRFKAHGESFSVLYLDLDGFKTINDKYGHPTGDEVLRIAGKRLESCVRPSDTIARIGGDEFIILLESVAVPMRTALVAERILQVISSPFNTQSGPLPCSISVGIAHVLPQHATGDELLAHADAALYHAKSLGKNRVHTYGA